MATATEISSFIKRLGRLAVNECNNRIKAGKGFVLPSVCIAQSALETGWGTAGIMVKANAFFGIKAGGSWNGAVYRADTWEVDSGGAYNTTANFRAYGSLEESVTDYYNLIGNNSRYANGLSYGVDKTKWLTPKQCITAIWSGGYATDTLYVEKIMNTITARNLTEYDKLVTGEGTLPDDTVLTFTKADLLQGKLVTADSGRTIVNDTTNVFTVSLNWEKAFTVNANAQLTIVLPDTLEMWFVTLVGDTATVLDGTHLKNGDTFTVVTGTTYGFTIMKSNARDLSIDEMEGVEIKLQTNYALPEGAEISVNGIAYFVKIE